MTIGADAAIDGSCRRWLPASSMVTVGDDPAPPRNPPADVEPDSTINKLLPIDCTELVDASVSRLRRSPASATTAATPMIMPSMVRSGAHAIAPQRTARLRPKVRRVGFMRWVTGTVVNDHAVLKADQPIGEVRRRRARGSPTMMVMPASRLSRLKTFMISLLVSRVQIAGRLVGARLALGEFDQCPGDGDPLLLAAGKTIRQ